MKELFAFLILFAVIALAFHALALYGRRSRHRRGTLAANIAEGTREFFSLIPDAVSVPSRYLLTKAGSDSLHFALTTTGDRAFGVCEDQTTGEGIPTPGLPFRIAILGIDNRTKKAAIQSTVNAYDYLTTDTNGFAKSVPAPTGTPTTYWVIGVATEAGAASGGSYPTIIEFIGCLPFQLTH